MRESWIPLLTAALVLSLPAVAISFLPGPTPLAESVSTKDPPSEDAKPSGIVFDTEFDEYSPGDVVRYFIWNRRDDGIDLSCPAPFWVERYVDSTWRSVDAHVCPAVMWYLDSDGRMGWHWTAETGTHDPDLPPVEPGLYRVGGTVWAGGEAIPLVAYFRIR